MRNTMRTGKRSGVDSRLSAVARLVRRRRRNGPLRSISLLVAATIALPLGVMAPLAAPSAQALDNGLALTPPMGWNSWNQVHCNDLSEAAVKSAVEAIVDRGLKSVGYEYVVVDDCWQGGRDDHGELFADPVRFPSGIEALATYVHDAGLKFGIYSSPGSETCANYWDGYPVTGIASFGHETQDAQTFADWGVDYLKYDWCRADVTNGLERPAAFAKMRDALAATGRPIVYGISEYGETKPWTWAGPVANLWRTTGDIGPRWSSVLSIINSQAGLSSYAGPSAWNDPDMLQTGNGSMTLAENRSHFGMWAMLAAPLFLGTDVSALSADVLAVVGNREIVDIDQDPLGAQAERISDVGGAQVWARRLAGDELAVAPPEHRGSGADDHHIPVSRSRVGGCLRGAGCLGAEGPVQRDPVGERARRRARHRDPPPRSRYRPRAARSGHGLRCRDALAGSNRRRSGGRVEFRRRPARRGDPHGGWRRRCGHRRRPVSDPFRTRGR